MSVAKHKEQFGNEILLKSAKEHSHWILEDYRLIGPAVPMYRTEGRKQGRNTRQPAGTRVCTLLSSRHTCQTEVAKYKIGKIKASSTTAR